MGIDKFMNQFNNTFNRFILQFLQCINYQYRYKYYLKMFVIKIKHLVFLGNFLKTSEFSINVKKSKNKSGIFKNPKFLNKSVIKFIKMGVPQGSGFTLYLLQS